MFIGGKNGTESETTDGTATTSSEENTVCFFIFLFIYLLIYFHFFFEKYSLLFGHLSLQLAIELVIVFRVL